MLKRLVAITVAAWSICPVLADTSSSNQPVLAPEAIEAIRSVKPFYAAPPGLYYAFNANTNTPQLCMFSIVESGGYPPGPDSQPTYMDPEATRKYLGEEMYNYLMEPLKPTKAPPEGKKSKTKAILKRFFDANEAARIRHQPTINVNYTIKQLPSGP